MPHATGRHQPKGFGADWHRMTRISPDRLGYHRPRVDVPRSAEEARFLAAVRPLPVAVVVRQRPTEGADQWRTRAGVSIRALRPMNRNGNDRPGSEVAAVIVCGRLDDECAHRPQSRARSQRTADAAHLVIGEWWESNDGMTTGRTYRSAHSADHGSNSRPLTATDLVQVKTAPPASWAHHGGSRVGRHRPFVDRRWPDPDQRGASLASGTSRLSVRSAEVRRGDGWNWASGSHQINAAASAPRTKPSGRGEPASDHASS